MQGNASPSQEHSTIQAAALEQELATLRERMVMQSEMLEERAGQISYLKEDRDRWRQQAMQLLVELKPASLPASESKLKWWRPF